ncbi:ATP-binding protein [Bacillus sp. B15-48]|uniref:two-component system histidine kinase PnpS n=1 Tax=Bacillus sp. B15-48 TaxID=1548601 RepID=UPI00193EF70D|nr:ATP-binding protein [Bacillus sp. B15-48]MBM4762527.1 HAMP domain-containing protein [Bacillus sp. B15-48]
MTKYKTRLLFALVTLIITVLLGLGVVLGQLFKNNYLNYFNERLKNEVQIVAKVIEKNGGIAFIDQEEMNEVGELLKTRITIVDSVGNILFDTGVDSGTTENTHKNIIHNIVADSINDDSGEYSFGVGIKYYWKSIALNGENDGYLFFATTVGELKQAYQHIWWILSISLGLALVVIVLLVVKITSRYTKPIESATNVAIELAKGNYRARTYEDHIDETGMLSASINILARNLQDLMKSQEMQQDRLSTLIENMGSGLILVDGHGYINLINKPYKEIFNVNPDQYLYKLYHEVVEHKEISSLIEEIFMTEQKTKKQVVLLLGFERRHFEVYGVPIIGTNNVWKGVLLVFHEITELKKLEQVRKDFVANVSHELKTPITSIKGFSETLLDGAMNDKKALESFLTIILKESDRLKILIEDLLELSRIEQTGYRLNLGKVNMNDLVSEAMTILKARADGKKIAFQHHSTDCETIIGDQDKLKQVMINLLTNAITYTPNGGLISVEVNETSDSVILFVKDTGIGMEKEEISRIFERFYRVDKARSRNSGGTGLGLAIVKHIIEAHKGNIQVSSDVGKGTTFKITLLKELMNDKL